jgi:hypothetical protein
MSFKRGAKFTKRIVPLVGSTTMRPRGSRSNHLPPAVQHRSIELELQQPCLLVYDRSLQHELPRVFGVTRQQDGDAVDFNVDVGRGGIAVPAALEERPVEVAHAPHILVSVFLGDLIGDDRQEALLRDAQ